MLKTVEGRYKDGKVSLAENPAGISEAKVLVTFLPVESPTEEAKPPQYIRFGQFSGPKQLTEEDFRIAEWRGDSEDPDADPSRP